MSRLRWPDSTNSVSEKPGTIQLVAERSTVTIGLSTEVLLKTGGRRTDPLPRRGY